MAQRSDISLLTGTSALAEVATTVVSAALDPRLLPIRKWDSKSLTQKDWVVLGSYSYMMLDILKQCQNIVKHL